MNDFTKEELKDMFTVISENYSGKELDELLDKIQSMIDKYCEHQWINGTYCEKCNRSPTECVNE